MPFVHPYYHENGAYVNNGGFYASSIETVTTGALDPNVPISLISVTGTVAYTLADGKYKGQRKTITVITTASTPDGTLTPASFADGTSLDLDAVSESVEIFWDGSNWRVLHLIGAAINA